MQAFQQQGLLRFPSSKSQTQCSVRARCPLEVRAQGGHSSEQASLRGLAVHLPVLTSGLRRTRDIQTRATQAPGTPDLASRPASAGASDDLSTLSFLGLGSRNSASIDDGSISDADDPRATAHAASKQPHTTSPGPNVLRDLQLAASRLGSSLEQLLFSTAAENMPGWDASQAAGVLCVLGFLRRCPASPWLDRYWAASLPLLRACAAADLAMLSFGINELQLQPPAAWAAELMEATLRAAEGTRAVLAPAPGPAGLGGPPAAAAVSSNGTWGNGSGGREPQPQSLLPGALAQAVAQVLEVAGARLPGPVPTAQPAPHGARSSLDFLRLPLVRSENGPAGRNGGMGPAVAAALSSASVLGALQPAEADFDSAAAFAAAAALGAAPPLDTDPRVGHAPEAGRRGASGSAIARELLVAPLAGLAAGARRAAGAAAEAWRARSLGSELVTVAYNLAAAGVRLEGAWLGRLTEALAPRLVDMSGDDLACLLGVMADAGCAAPSAAWRARLYARVDGINWALQPARLVACLSALHSLGMRPPAPWAHRQLRALQPGLALLPPPALVDLTPLLPLLAPPPSPPPSPSPSPALSSSPSSASASLPHPAGSLLSKPAAALAALASLAAPPPPPHPLHAHAAWAGAWLADYRAAVAAAARGLAASDLLFVIEAMDAAVFEQGSYCLPRSGGSGDSSAGRGGANGSIEAERGGGPGKAGGGAEEGYGAWRAAMVAAVAARLPEAGVAGLCAAWQVLAGAGTGAGVAAAESRVAAGPAAAAAAAAGDDGLEALRAMVADGLASARSRLRTSDVAPVLASLAAAPAPPPPAALEALLGAAQPLLPGLTSGELVGVAGALVRLGHRPNLAWQAAFCAASRRRLGLMTPGQRVSLLVAAATLGLHLPDPWVKDFLAASERGLADTADDTSTDTGPATSLTTTGSVADGAALDGSQMAQLLWAVSCVSAEPPASWLAAWEAASAPLLPGLGPNLLAVALKALSTLHHVPSPAWQAAFFAALQPRLFAPAAGGLTWPAPSPSAPSAPSSPAAPIPLLASEAVTPATLASLVYSLAALDLAPPAALLDELCDGCRCRLSALPTLDLEVLLAYLVARGHRPHEEWWEAFLECLAGRLEALAPGELASLLVMVHALRVAPPGPWLEAFCASTQPRLAAFQPSQLLQVLSCLHLFRHRPSGYWLAACAAAAEGQLPRLPPTELARLVMLLDAAGHLPAPPFMAAFYAASGPGLAALEAQELANVAWAVASCSLLPPSRSWLESLMAAARPRLPGLEPAQLRVLCGALGQLARGAGPHAGAADGFLTLAQEFLV